MMNDKTNSTTKSAEDALGKMLDAGETNPSKLIAGLRAQGYTVSAGTETQAEEEREGEPMPMSLDDAIAGAVKGAVPMQDEEPAPESMS